MNLAYAISLLYLTFGVILILLGLIILKENLQRPLNRITGLMMVFAGMGPLLAAFGLLIPENPELLRSLTPFLNIFLIWELFFPLLLLFSLHFPYEYKWIRKRTGIQFLIFVPHLIHLILLFFFDSPGAVTGLIDTARFSSGFGIVLQPLLIILSLVCSLLGLIYSVHEHFFSLVNLIYSLLTMLFMSWGYRRMRTTRQKFQVRWVIWGIRLSMLLYAFAFLFPRLNLIRTPTAASHFLTTLALLIGAGSIAWAIIRYQFMDIRLIIKRGFIYSVVYAILIGIYLLIYSQSKRLVTAILGIQIPILEVLFIIIALFFFQPILSVVESLIEKRLIKDTKDFRHILSELSREIMSTLDMAELKGKIVTTLQDSMGIEQVSLLTTDRDGDLVLEQAQKRIVLSGREEWVSLLLSLAEPVGFDDLCLRAESSRGLSRLRSLSAFLIVPLIHLDDLVGLLALSEKSDGSRYTAEDLTILSILSSQAAIAIENSKLVHDNLIKHRMEEELRLARDIQTNLLPTTSPQSPHFELVGYNLPSKEVGGDYYDFIPLDKGRIGIAIGDISGKGIPAALLMSNLQAALRVSAALCSSTDQVMDRVNGQISRTTAPEKFATFFYGILDMRARTLEYTNAGHNYPILIRKNGEIRLLKEGGMVVGIMGDVTYAAETIQVGTDDLLMMYTDGLSEAINQDEEEFGEKRLLELISRICHLEAQQVMDLILEEAVNFTHGQLQSDDLTMVVLKIR